MILFNAMYCQSWYPTNENSVLEKSIRIALIIKSLQTIPFLIIYLIHHSLTVVCTLSVFPVYKH